MKCDPVTSNTLPKSSHMCFKHLVRPSKDEMRK